MGLAGPLGVLPVGLAGLVLPVGGVSRRAGVERGGAEGEKLVRESDSAEGELTGGPLSTMGAWLSGVVSGVRVRSPFPKRLRRGLGLRSWASPRGRSGRSPPTSRWGG